MSVKVPPRSIQNCHCSADFTASGMERLLYGVMHSFPSVRKNVNDLLTIYQRRPILAPAMREATVRKTAAVQGSTVGPIVSSAHLAAGAMPALSELEFGLILLGHAFNRWMVRCAAA